MPAVVIQEGTLCWRFDFSLSGATGLTTITKGAPLFMAASMEFEDVGAEIVLVLEVAAIERGMDVEAMGCEDDGRMED